MMVSLGVNSVFLCSDFFLCHTPVHLRFLEMEMFTIGGFFCPTSQLTDNHTDSLLIMKAQPMA